MHTVVLLTNDEGYGPDGWMREVYARVTCNAPDDDGNTSTCVGSSTFYATPQGATDAFEGVCPICDADLSDYLTQEFGDRS